jgi:hypothetical protein
MNEFFYQCPLVENGLQGFEIPNGKILEELPKNATSPKLTFNGIFLHCGFKRKNK